ncbi:tRNA (guanosine(37)-N1)-methyltransferase TrmD [bacterium SCSIO 12643]|nr:tRNA (guanosine(37)-N1)-methyltransferase TrmD [bacterium SCSIO 12643]
MRIDIVTLFPEIFNGPFSESIVKRAIENQIVSIHFHNPRDYSQNKHKKVDDYQFGGGAGMVMMVEPLALLLDELLNERTYDAVIYMTPDGHRLEQKDLNQYSSFDNIIIINGHYKGIDQRIRDHYVTHEISIGDYVLSGGELATSVFCDALIRLIPGAIGDGTSALSDSFQDDLLAPPVYTRPAEFRGWKVPEILTSGNLKAIDDWRHEQAVSKTLERKPWMLKD